MTKNTVPAKLPNPLADALRDLTVWFQAENIPHSVIGGIAVALTGTPRVTEDIDAVILLDTNLLDLSLEQAKEYGFIPRISDAADFARRRRVLLLQHAPTSINVDLSCGVLPFENELILRAREVTIGVLKIRIASPEDLIRCTSS